MRGTNETKEPQLPNIRNKLRYWVELGFYVGWHLWLGRRTKLIYFVTDTQYGYIHFVEVRIFDESVRMRETTEYHSQETLFKDLELNFSIIK